MSRGRRSSDHLRDREPADPRDRNLGYFNRAAAAAHGDRVAVIDLSRDPAAEIGHARLDERMERVAAALAGLGLAPGERLLLAMDNRHEFIEVFFGAMRAGIVPVPLNVKLAAETIAFIVADSGCRAAVISPGCHPRIEAVADRAGLETRIATTPAPDGWRDYETVLCEADPSSFTPPPIAARQLAFLPYTSGSTGRPKGVRLAHDGMLWGIRSAQRHWPAEPGERALIAGPLYHKNAMRVSIKPKLHAGASVVVLPRFEPRAYLEALARYRCTEAGGVPAMYRMMLAEEDLLAALDFSALRVLEMGSAVVGAELIASIERAFAVRVIEAYGLTEGGGPLREPTNGGPAPRGSCGLAAPEVEVKLAAADGGEDPNAGELWVRSPAVLLGYHNRPDLDAERLVGGWLKTNDLFRRDREGFFYFQGRTDDQFSCGGENINPKEVELLLVQHEAVIDAAVAPVPHTVKGLAPAALVTIRRGRSVEEETLKRFALAHGPAYAHPRRVFVVDALPVGGTGKIDRRAVRERLQALIAAHPAEGNRAPADSISPDHAIGRGRTRRQGGKRRR